MDDYIKRSALLEELKKRDFLPAIVKRALEVIPSEDVAPVVHGKWIFNDDWLEYRCTNCNKAIENIKKYEYCYCPYCGAKMDL